MNGLHQDSHLPNVRAYVAPENNVRQLRPVAGRPVEGERKRFVAKGHDAQLQDAQYQNTEIRLTTISGEIVFGRIVRRDKFTITLEITQGSEQGAHEIFYKHGIESLQIKKSDAARAVNKD